MFLQTAQNSGCESRINNEYFGLKSISGRDDEKIRVLPVDDEPVLPDVTGIFPERSGNFIVGCCDSAAETLKKPECSNYDAVVCDYGMPEMNGPELLSEIRSPVSDIPSVIFTGKSRGMLRLSRTIFGNSDFCEGIVVRLLIFSTFLYPADILDIT